MRGLKSTLFAGDDTRCGDGEESPITFVEWGATGRTGTLIAAMRIPERGTIRARVGRATGRWAPAFGALAEDREPILIPRQVAKPVMQALRETSVPCRFKGRLGLDGMTYSIRVTSEWTSLDIEWWSRAPAPWEGVCALFNALTERLAPGAKAWPRATTR